MLRKDLWFERAHPIPWDVDVQFSEVPFDFLTTRPVARIATVIAGRVVLLVPKVMGQFGVHGSLQHSLDEPLQQPVLAGDVFWLLIILQKLVN
jgi:hypothetical protein